MAKDKKKKKKDDTKKAKPKSVASKKVTAAAKKLKAVTDNPLMADIVAAALVATAAALKDSKKARALAATAGDELESLAKSGADRGNALWLLALDVGKRALEEFASDKAPPKRASKK